MTERETEPGTRGCRDKR